MEPRHWLCKPAYSVLSPARIKWKGCGRKASAVKMGDDGNKSLVSPDGVAPIWMVSVSAHVIFPCTIKFRRRLLLLAPAHLGSPGRRAIKQLPLCYLSNG